jgi:hypothetical protein
LAAPNRSDRRNGHVGRQRVSLEKPNRFAATWRFGGIGADHRVPVRRATGGLRRHAPAAHAALHKAKGAANYDSMIVVENCGMSSEYLAMYTTFRNLSGRLIVQLLVLLPVERSVRIEKRYRGRNKGHGVRILERCRRDGFLEIVRKVC